MDAITQSEYWAEVKAIARAAVENCERNPDNAHDAALEAVDGHQWIIYTWYNAQVLMHCSNHDAMFETVGEVTANSYSEIMMQMAFYALLEDVEAEMSSLFESEEDVG